MTTQLATQLALAAESKRRLLQEIERICAWLLGQPHRSVVLERVQGTSFIKQRRGWVPARGAGVEPVCSLELAMHLVQEGRKHSKEVRKNAHSPGLGWVETTCVQLVRTQ